MEAPRGLPLAGDVPWEQVAAAIGRGGADDVEPCTSRSIRRWSRRRRSSERTPRHRSRRPADRGGGDRPLAPHPPRVRVRARRDEGRHALAEVLAHRKGVCQDFAHVASRACVRSGSPLGTSPGTSRPIRRGDAEAGRERCLARVVSPRSSRVRAGWTSTPRTTRCLVSGTSSPAFGRDYSDVAPVSGVIYTHGRTTSLDVTVDVIAETPNVRATCVPSAAATATSSCSSRTAVPELRERAGLPAVDAAARASGGAPGRAAVRERVGGALQLARRGARRGAVRLVPHHDGAARRR